MSRNSKGDVFGKQAKLLFAEFLFLFLGWWLPLLSWKTSKKIWFLGIIFFFLG